MHCLNDISDIWMTFCISCQMSGEPSRHRGKGGKVFPAGQSYNNEGFEMENQDEEKDNR